MREAKCAIFWNIKPWEFRNYSRDRKAELMAIYAVSEEVEGYYNSEQAKRMQKQIEEIDDKHATDRGRRGP